MEEGLGINPFNIDMLFHMKGSNYLNLLFFKNNIFAKILMKILIVRLSSIGDILLTTPMVRCLYQQSTDIEIHFLTKNLQRYILA